MSPRRSSRARSSQQPPQGPNHTNSTASTNAKLDRDSRAPHRANSPRRSSTQPSESADGADTSRLEQAAPRRSRRNGEDKESIVKQLADDEENDIEAADEEVTRCICGQAEYPGPSLVLRQEQPNPEAVTDDTGNFFVQCDNCGVWQHGGCMGLLDESMLPEEYYCEQCKPEFHKIIRASNG
jgi:DNA mismatch repair ATPase MutL